MESGVGISRSMLERLLAEAAQSPSQEICGLLFGDDAAISAATTCRNVAADPSMAFEIDPAALFAAHKAMRAGGPKVIGHYHSHPTGLAAPSAVDAAAAMGGELWLIIAGGDATLWRATNDGAWLERFDRVPIRSTAPCAAAIASP
ncbi:MAG: M67 family metallopeptidase [Sphingomonas sp.]|nr:M67 family metallopeptidase [Sphingomonas sp.]